MADDGIAETDADSIIVKQLALISPVEFLQSLCMKALRRGSVYDKPILQGKFFKYLHKYIR